MTLREDLAEALRLGETHRIDKAVVASLPRDLRSSLVERVNPSYELTGYDIDATKEICRENIERARAIIAAACQPISERKCIAEITRCLTVCASRQRDGSDVQGMIEIFLDELQEFPEDVVKTAFRGWMRREKWWPTLAEIRDQCQREFRARKSLKEAIDSLASRGVL